MSLTKKDLQAIKGIVTDVVEDSKLQTAAGFAEVHKKIDKVHHDLADRINEVDDKLRVKDGKLENTVQRVDRLEKHVGIA